MKLTIPFSKYAGCGNDFIFIDNRTGCLLHNLNVIEHLCDRKKGIGADGVILVEASTKADFKMRIFNADGGEAEMCGNGARCLFRFLHEISPPKSQYHIETMCSHIALRLVGDDVCVSMPNLSNKIEPVPLAIDQHDLLFHYLNTGVPHTVAFVPSVNDDQWISLAPKIRFHNRFQPAGVNVNFVQMDDHHCLHIRTYERGVEAETLACGTGATAAGLVAAQLFNLPPPITIVPRSKEILKINFKKKGPHFSHIELLGPTLFLFKDHFTLND